MRCGYWLARCLTCLALCRAWTSAISSIAAATATAATTPRLARSVAITVKISNKFGGRVISPAEGLPPSRYGDIAAAPDSSLRLRHGAQREAATGGRRGPGRGCGGTKKATREKNARGKHQTPQ